MVVNLVIVAVVIVIGHGAHTWRTVAAQLHAEHYRTAHCGGESIAVTPGVVQRVGDRVGRGRPLKAHHFDDVVIGGGKDHFRVISGHARGNETGRGAFEVQSDGVLPARSHNGRHSREIKAHGRRHTGHKNALFQHAIPAAHSHRAYPGIEISPIVPAIGAASRLGAIDGLQFVSYHQGGAGHGDGRAAGEVQHQVAGGSCRAHAQVTGSGTAYHPGVGRAGDVCLGVSHGLRQYHIRPGGGGGESAGENVGIGVKVGRAVFGWRADLFFASRADAALNFS